MNEPNDGIPYTVAKIGTSYSVVQAHNGRFEWLSAMQFDSQTEAQGHADSLNYLRERRLASSPIGKGLHWPPSPSSLR